MSKWITRALGKFDSTATIDDALLDEKVVILMQGKNPFGDQIYAYLQLTMRSLYELKKKTDAGENFTPSDYGTVLAAGKGEPPEDLKIQMREEHNMVEVPQASPRPAAFAQPHFWGDEEESKT